METFSTLLVLCAGNSPATGEFPTQSPVTRSFDVFYDLCLNNGSVNNREAGDLRRHRAHYDVIVMNVALFHHGFSLSSLLLDYWIKDLRPATYSSDILNVESIHYEHIWAE